MQNGDLIQINDTKNLKKKDIKKIIDLGEILIPFGEFIENNSLLPDSSYVYEWWIQDLQKKIGCLPKDYSYKNVQDAEEKTIKKINKEFNRNINLEKPSWTDVIDISKKYDIPLHPYYNLFWHDISIEELVLLSNFVKENGTISKDSSLILPKDEEIKRILIALGALHKYKDGNLNFDYSGNSVLYSRTFDKSR